MIALFPMLMFILAGVIIAPHVNIKAATFYSTLLLSIGFISWSVIIFLGM